MSRLKVKIHTLSQGRRSFTSPWTRLTGQINLDNRPIQRSWNYQQDPDQESPKFSANSLCARALSAASDLSGLENSKCKEEVLEE